MSQCTPSDHLPSENPLVAWATTSQSADSLPMVRLSDPLGTDRPDDPVLMLTHRQIGRLIFVAAETAARFARECLDLDPADWMCAPRRIFGGSNAVTACADRQMFIRALVLHGVSSSLDMNPDEVDLLLEDSGDAPEQMRVIEGTSAHSASDSSFLTMVKERALFTACAVDESASGMAYVFYAAVAADEDEVRDQLRSRAGARLAYMADVELGFDPSEPIAMALLSDAMADLINHVADDPASQLSAGFRLFVEHRFED